MAQRPMPDAEIAPILEKSIDDYVARQSWFYESQLKPYLAPMVADVLAQLHAAGIHFVKDIKAAKP